MVVQNLKLPGVKVAFQLTSGTAIVSASEGRSVFVVPKSWGPDSTFIEADRGTDFLSILGKELKDLLEIRESFKGNGRALIYLPAMAGSAKASATGGGVTATAKYAGSRGNDIQVVITKNVDNSFTVKTVLANNTVDEQLTVTTAPESNDFVDFSGATTLEDATLTLVGGEDGTLNSSAYADFLAGLEKYDFSHIAVGADTEDFKSLARAKVQELRSIGRPVTLVTNNYNADFEGVISAHNGVTLENGEELKAKDTVYWLAAASASAETNSLTYASYPGAVDCERLTRGEVIDAVEKGQIVYVYKNNRVVVQQDINTLTTFSDTKNQDFSKNRIVRTMARIENGVTNVFEESFLGKFVNNEDGRDGLKSSIIATVLDPLEAVNAIQFDAGEIVIEQGANKDAVVVTVPVVINDAMEKLYVQVALQ